LLVEFRVENFKNFKCELTYRLDQVKNFEFSNECIKHDVIKTALVYGINGSGKSNLGLALFDISLNLTDKRKNFDDYIYYKNLITDFNPKFYYKFKFESSYLEYIYEKDTPQHMVKEELIINGNKVAFYDHILNKGETNLEGTETLNTDLNKKNISFIKYISNNSVLINNPINSVFTKFIDFVNKMLIFNSLENNVYSNNFLSTGIIDSGKLKEFEFYLKKFGIEFSLVTKIVDCKKEIFCNYGKKQVNFFNIISSGTRSLTLFYYWLINFDKVSLVFIDDFDAFYDYKLAKDIVQEIVKFSAQAIITTHNSSLIDNELLRPDCYFNLAMGKIESFSNLTKKELRKAHNVEKMYRAGTFDH